MRSAMVPRRVSSRTVYRIRPFGSRNDTVNAGHQRELAGRGVVRAVRLGADAGVEPGGEDLHDDLAVTVRPGIGVLEVARWGIK